MSDEELEQDELEASDDDDTGDDLPAGDDADTEVEDEDEGEAVSAPAGKKAKAAVSVDELPSMEAKQKERDALERAMQEFLARGGKVQEVEANVVADPPKKPDNKYGSRPI